jgi:Tol biopolymer transport system component/C-terminal processing protease CtpA/Prc
MTAAIGALLAAALLAIQDEPVRFPRHPALSPDGTRVAFSFRGDLWMASVEGGRARRLTRTPQDESMPAWSPDGARLAFVSDEEGQCEVYVLEVESGAARRLTFHEAEDRAPAWSPDGRWIAFESNRDPQTDLPANARWFDVWRVPAAGGTPERVTRFGGGNPAWSRDGRWIAFDRYASGYGDGEHDIFVVESEGGVPRRLAAGPEDARRPTFLENRIVYAGRPPGRRNWRLRSVRISGEEGEFLPASDLHDRWPSASRDLVAFVRGFDLFLASSGVARRIEVLAPPPDPEADRVESLKEGLEGPRPCPRGAEILGTLKGDVWVVPLHGGAARRLTATVEEERNPGWIAGGGALFVRGHAGGPGVLCAIEEGRVRELTPRKEDFRSPQLSPDGGRIAYFVEGPGGLDLRVIDLEGKIVLERARRDVDEGFPAFSPDGRRIAYLRFDPSKGRTELIAVTLADGREEILYEEPGECRDLDWSPDGRKLAWCRETDTGYMTARVLEIESKILRRLPRRSGVSVRRPSWMPDSSRLVVEERFVARGVEDAASCATAVVEIESEGGAERVSFEAVRRISLRDEMAELFVEAWGHYRRGFYDPEFHGAPWERLREEMIPIAAACRTKAELYELISWLLEELRASHVQHRPPSGTSRIETGALGLEGRVTEGGLRVVRTLRGGPADWAGIRPGDTLVAVGGVPLAGRSIDEFLSVLRGEALPQPEFAIRRGEDGFVVRMRPLSMAELREARYRELIELRKGIVSERSGGRLAYHHVQYMAEAEVRRLAAALREEFGGAEGLILDIRDGVGGLAHWQFLALLDASARDRFEATPALMTRSRDGRKAPDACRENSIGGALPAETLWRKPVALVQNEVTRSDKEIFSYLIGRSGRAWRVGTITAGGVIGGHPIRLRDGSSIVLPVQGWFTSEGRNLEGMGVRPDHEVPLSVEDLHAGRDPQLDKAIEILMLQVEGRLQPPAPR